ncbi:hypothetical protein AB0L22_09370 [Micromonospora haikouensis]|uniref:hypothetical protein n=1 Tax=Micromonospora haikouensis TaxID=686309 RepID=UPI003414DA7A
MTDATSHTISTAAGVKVCEVCGSELHRKIMGDGKPEKPSQFRRRTTCSKECRYRAVGDKNGARLDLLPWSVGRRTLLAKTCPACGELLPASRFQRQARGFYATNCGRCTRREWLAGQEQDARTEVVRGVNAWTKRQNDTMRADARRHGSEWTGPELEVVARTDLTAVQVASMLGRTPAAVRAQRHLLKKVDPKTTALAGVSRPDDPRG